MLLSTALRGYAGIRVHGPWISPDESVYALLGQSLYGHGTLEILRGPTPFYSLVVPALVGPFLSFSDLHLGYELLKPFQALVMSLAAVPVYLWARSVSTRGWALGAAVLTLAVPGLAYSGLVMTEVAFYPVLALAAWLIARAIAEPSAGRQTWAVLAVALASLTRLQALILLPVALLAVGLDAWFARQWRRAWRSAGLVGGIAGVLVLWIVVQRLRGEPALGAYDSVRQNQGLGSAAKFVLWHAGDVVLASGVVPVCALLALVATFAARGERDDRTRATVATTAALVGGLVVQVGFFASQNVGHLAERDLLGVLPALFACFALWLHRAGPRSYGIAAGSALVALAALFALPLRTLVVSDGLPDSMTIAPLWRLSQVTSMRTVEIVVLAVAAGLAAAWAVVPRRWLAALPATLIAIGVVASVSASRVVEERAAYTRVTLVGPNAQWIDDGARTPVSFVYDAQRDWPAVWQALFWNRRIAEVLRMDTPVPGPLPQRKLYIVPGGAMNVREPSAVFPSTFQPVGTHETTVPQLVPGQSGLSLWALAPPPRLALIVTGTQANGDIYGTATAVVTAYDCRPGGSWKLTFIVKEWPSTITLSQDGKLLMAKRFANPGVWNATIPVAPPPRSPAVCDLSISPTGLVGTTQLLYLPPG